MRMLLVWCLMPLALIAQEVPDSKGRDFWFCFMPNYHNGGYDFPSRNQQDSIFIYVAAERPTAITLRYTPHDGRPEQVIQERIEDPQQMLTIKMSYYGVELKGITAGGRYFSIAERHTQRPVPFSFHLTSDEDVTVYALNHADKTSDAFLVLPTDALGKDYYIMSYNADVYGAVGTNTPSQFAIVATEDSTVVEFVRLAAQTTDGPATRVMLQQGEVYLVQSVPDNDRFDLTGSRVKANKPIAVFGGHQRVRVPLGSRNIASSRDCLIEQMPPINTWGRSALLVNFPDPPDEMRLGPDRFRILAARDSTVIYMDSIPLRTLNAGQFYEGDLNAPHVIHANRPILVTAYRHTSSPTSVYNTDLLLGDPFMMVIPPPEQFQQGYRFICPLAYEDSAISPREVARVEVYKYHYVTIVAPDTALQDIELDGQTLPANIFRPIPKSRYYYALQRLNAGVHTVSARAPIGIYVFGYGFADSYGYVGGMSFRRYDFDPPTISALPPCPPYRLVVYDTLPGDSRVDVVRIIEDSTQNVAWRIERESMLPQDSVVVHLSVLDPYEDAVITLVAEDAEQFVTRKRVVIPGMTLRIATEGGVLSRPPMQYTYRSATQRSSCFTVPIVNAGIYPQTLLRAESRFGIVRGDQLPALVVAGDTVKLLVCYRTDQTQLIYDTLWFETPCGRYTAAIVNIEFIVDSLPPSIQRALQDCPPLHTLTFSEKGYTQTGIASITVLDSFNVVVRLENISEQVVNSAELQRLSIAQRDWRLDAWYHIEAIDSVGNKSTIEGTFEGHTVMIANRDSLYPQQQFLGPSSTFLCDTIELFNFGRYPKRFERVVQRGIEFSLPPSWMPIVIAPGERVRVPICALIPFYDARKQTVYHDTLVLTVGCYERRMPVTVTVLSTEYRAHSSCGVEVGAGQRAETPQLLTEGSDLIVTLPYTTDGTITLYSTAGRCLHTDRFNGAVASLGLMHLPAGAYWVIIHTATAIYRLPLLWHGQ